MRLCSPRWRLFVGFRGPSEPRCSREREPAAEAEAEEIGNRIAKFDGSVRAISDFINVATQVGNLRVDSTVYGGSPN